MTRKTLNLFCFCKSKSSAIRTKRRLEVNDGYLVDILPHISGFKLMNVGISDERAFAKDGVPIK